MGSLPTGAVLALEQTGWLSRVPQSVRAMLLNSCLSYKLTAGEAITQGGEETGGIFGIASGTAGVYSAIGSSEGPLIHIAGTGYWFGLFPLTSGRPRIIAVTARSPCVVAQLPQSILQGMLEQDPSLWRWLCLLALESAALSVQGLADQLIDDAERRCAAILLRVADCRESGDAPSTAFLTQYDLAALGNLSRPSVSLAVRSLSARGLITPGYRAITINAPAQLRKFVG